MLIAVFIYDVTDDVKRSTYVHVFTFRQVFTIVDKKSSPISYTATCNYELCILVFLNPRGRLQLFSVVASQMVKKEQPQC